VYDRSISHETLISPNLEHLLIDRASAVRDKLISTRHGDRLSPSSEHRTPHTSAARLGSRYGFSNLLTLLSFDHIPKSSAFYSMLICLLHFVQIKYLSVRHVDAVPSWQELVGSLSGSHSKVKAKKPLSATGSQQHSSASDWMDIAHALPQITEVISSHFFEYKTD
jgi:hypothetical protein